MTEIELQEIIKKHALWILDEEGGERANLSDANLRGAYLRDAYLSDANLRGVIGNAKEIISGQTLKYHYAYTSEVLQIGCERHPIKDWWGFDDETIGGFADDAIEEWRKLKPILQALIAAYPAVPTGADVKQEEKEVAEVVK